MPELYIFAVCSDVIIDKSETASLISLFGEIKAFLPPEAGPVPRDAVAPKEWAVFTSWRQRPEDGGRQYRQKIQILYPDGTPFGAVTEVDFAFQAGKSHHQLTTKWNGFPIGQTGMYSVKMWLEGDGSTVFGPVSIGVNVQHERTNSPPGQPLPLASPSA